MRAMSQAGPADSTNTEYALRVTHRSAWALARPGRLIGTLVLLAAMVLGVGSPAHAEDFFGSSDDGVTSSALVETGDNGTYVLVAKLVLPSGRHVYAESDDGLQGFAWAATKVEGVAYATDRASTTDPVSWVDPTFGDKLKVFKGTIEIRVPFTVDPVLAGDTVRPGLSMSFSSCDDERCYLRRTALVDAAMPAQGTSALAPLAPPEDETTSEASSSPQAPSGALAPLPPIEAVRVPGGMPIPAPLSVPSASGSHDASAPASETGATAPRATPRSATPPRGSQDETTASALDGWPGGARAQAQFVLSGTCVRVVIRPQPGYCLYLPGNEGVTPVGLTPTDADGVTWGVPELPQGGICSDPVHLMIPVARQGDVPSVSVTARWQVCAPGGACLPPHEERFTLAWPAAAPAAEGEVGLIAPVTNVPTLSPHVESRPFRETLLLFGPLLLAALLGAGAVAYGARLNPGPWLAYVRVLGLAALLALGMMGAIELGVPAGLLFVLCVLAGVGVWGRHALLARARKVVPGGWMLQGAVTALLFTASAGAVLTVARAPDGAAPLPRFEAIDTVAHLTTRLQRSAREDRPVVVALIDPTCTACKQLDTLIGTDPAVRRELGKLVRLRVDVSAEEAEAICDALGMPQGEAPYLVFLDRDGRIQRGAELAAWSGEETRGAILARLQHVLRDAFGAGEGAALRWQAPRPTRAPAATSRPALADLGG